MKITNVQTRTVKVPMRPPIISKSGRFDAMYYVLVDVETDAAGGLTGSSYLWSFSEAGSAAIASAIRELGEVAKGEDPMFTSGLWQRMWQKIAQWGHEGISVIGLAGIDSAAWDIVGKVANLPLAQILGAHRDPVPAYASGGLWLTDDLDALAREASDLVAQGFRAMKMRIGRPKISEDVAAVGAVRNAIGPDVGLMVDVNSSWPSANHAIRAGRALEQFELLWIEDPLAYDDLVGHATISATLDVPICFGEKLYSPRGFRRLLEAKSADILMPDLQRVGGVTGWQRVAAIAAAWDYPVCSHLFPELNVHLVASAPTASYLEFMTWTAELFDEPIQIQHDGTVSVPNRPGFGIVWNNKAVEKMRLA